MHTRSLVISWVFMLALLLPLGASAENSQDFGDYVLHYNALATDMLPPAVARDYHITRSQHRGMLPEGMENLLDSMKPGVVSEPVVLVADLVTLPMKMKAVIDHGISNPPPASVGPLRSAAPARTCCPGQGAR